MVAGYRQYRIHEDPIERFKRSGPKCVSLVTLRNFLRRHSLHSTIPVAFLGDAAEDRKEGIVTPDPLPGFIDGWLGTFLTWSPEHKTKALDAIISV